MSVYMIYYDGGAKKMRPVLSEAQYRALRDDAKNREVVAKVRAGDAEQKRKLLQMNYSCIPKADGSLKGCKTPSTTVGMDIDFDPLDPQYDQKMATVPELILSKKDELGLLMLERSATKGYHVVFKRHEEMTQEENLQWASELLSVKYDEGAKDITRVFFTTTASPDDLLFLDKAIFEQRAAREGDDAARRSTVGNGGAKQQEAAVATEAALATKTMATEKALPASLHAFDLCVKSAGLSLEQMDVWGEHNWHSNLMSVLSVGLAKLMSREQVLAVVAERLPNYAQTEDCQKLIAYFYDNYTADKGFMSVALRGINAQAQQMARAEMQEEEPMDPEEQKNVKALAEGWTPPPLPKKVPRLMELLAGNYDPRFREMMMLSALPALSAHASHFRAIYLHGDVIGPQQYVSVIGSSGQGKSNCTKLYKAMVEHTLKAHDDNEWVKVHENAEMRDRMTNAKERPARYHPKLRLFETTSKSSILELQTNLGKNGMLLGQFSEVDALSSALKTGYSNISVLLRKGWDMDDHTQYYMNDSTCNTTARMSISLLAAGTVKAMLERLFTDSNCESGLMQRFIPVLVPQAKRTFRPPRVNYLTEDEKLERDALLMELYQKDLSLGESTLVLDTPLMTDAIGKWFDELEERYTMGLLTEAEADLSHRCGEFMMRAAIPLIALYGGETKEIVDFCRWVGEMAHYTLCRLFGLRMQQDQQSAQELLQQRPDARKTALPLLDQLPAVFTTKELVDLRVRVGQSENVKMLLSRLVKNGVLERVGRGVYKKLGASCK